MRKIYIYILVALFAKLTSFIQAQENDIGRVTGNRLYQFDKKDMTPIGVGHLVSIGKKTISVELSSGKTVSLQVSLLSKKDTTRLKYVTKELQAIAKSRAAAEKLEKRLLSNDPKSQIRVCRQLRGLKISTNSQLRILERIIKETEDPKLAYEALMAFAETCNTSKENLEFIIDRGARKHQRFSNHIEYDPEDFILALSRWNALSIIYLKQLAFSGDFILPPEEAFLSTPIRLPPSDSMRTKVRAYASVSIGLTQISYPETYSATGPLLLTLLSSAQVRMNNQFDKGSVRAIILAIRRQGFYNDKSVEALNRLKQTFPKEVEFALKILNENKKTYQECYRLDRRTRYRFYLAKNNKDLLWAHIEGRVGDNIIFIDQYDKRISVPLNSFSLKSQEAILGQLKSP